MRDHCSRRLFNIWTAVRGETTGCAGVLTSVRVKTTAYFWQETTVGDSFSIYTAAKWEITLWDSVLTFVRVKPLDIFNERPLLETAFHQQHCLKQKSTVPNNVSTFVLLLSEWPLFFSGVLKSVQANPLDIFHKRTLFQTAFQHLYSCQARDRCFR